MWVLSTALIFTTEDTEARFARKPRDREWFSKRGFSPLCISSVSSVVKDATHNVGSFDSADLYHGGHGGTLRTKAERQGMVFKKRFQSSLYFLCVLCGKGRNP